MPTVTDIDGNTYNTVQIGTQCWMAENLKTTTYQNNTPIPNVTNEGNWSNLTIGAYVWYDNDTIWKNIYGGLYNWYTTDDTNGLCPTGWHIPTNDEWTMLIGFIGGSQNGNMLKSCRQVNSPMGGGCNTYTHPRWDQNDTQYGTDDYGFSTLSGGNRTWGGEFYGIGVFGTRWSLNSGNVAGWFFSLYYHSGTAELSTFSKKSGFSVRCVMD